MASTNELLRRLAAASIVTAIALSAAPALAEPSPADKQRATQLLDEGFERREKGDEQGALKAFGAADTIMNVPVTGIEVARSQAALSMLVEARETATRVTKIPVRAKEPPPFAQARKDAEQMLAELGARIPTLQIELNGLRDGETADVRIDNDAIPAEELKSPRRLNPGSHRIIARYGGDEKTESVTLAEKDAKTVTFDFGGGAGKRDAHGGGEGPSAMPKVLMYGGFGLGLVGIGVGTGTGIMSFSAVESAKQNCVGNQCTASSAGGDVDKAKTLGNVSTVSFIVGGVGIVAGVVGLLLDKDPAPPKSGAGVSAVIGPGSIALRGRF
jgi:hypothetical protein